MFRKKNKVSIYNGLQEQNHWIGVVFHISKSKKLFKYNNLVKLDELQTRYKHRYFSMVYKNELRICYKKESTIYSGENFKTNVVSIPIVRPRFTSYERVTKIELRTLSISSNINGITITRNDWQLHLNAPNEGESIVSGISCCFIFSNLNRPPKSPSSLI